MDDIESRIGRKSGKKAGEFKFQEMKDEIIIIKRNTEEVLQMYWQQERARA